jgi:hypothetical protein
VARVGGPVLRFCVAPAVMRLRRLQHYQRRGRFWLSAPI